MPAPKPKMKLLYPEGRKEYCVEMYTTPKGIYVGRRFASHGCLLRWSVLRAVLRRAQKEGRVKADARS